MNQEFPAFALRNAALASAGALAGEIIGPRPEATPARCEPGVQHTIHVRRMGLGPVPISSSGAVVISVGTPGDPGAAWPFEVVNEVLTSERKTLSKIAALASDTSTDNWDGEGGRPVDGRQWDDARNVVSRAARELLGIPPPFVSACGDGTAHLQWTTAGGDRGVIEIGKDTFWWSFLPMSHRDVDDELVQLRSPDQAFEKIRKLFG